MKWLALISLVIGLSAHSAENKRMSLSQFVSKDVDVNKLGPVEVSLNWKGKSMRQEAEDLALLAERLFYTQGFIYTAEVANKALALDPDNKRAKFYYSLGLVVEQFRGLMKRVLPLAKNISTSAVHSLGAGLDRLPVNLRKFLLDGPQDIETAEELQNWFLAVRSQIRQLSAEVKSWDHSLFRLNMYSLVHYVRYWDHWEQDFIYREVTGGFGGMGVCPVHRIGRDTYVFEACDGFSHLGTTRLVRQSFIVDQLDAKGIKAGLDGLNIMFSLPTGVIDISGLEVIAKKIVEDVENSNAFYTEKEVVDMITSQPKMLDIKELSVLTDIKLDGLEFLDALEWFQTNHGDFCSDVDGFGRSGHLLGPVVCAMENINQIIFTGRDVLENPFPIARYNRYGETTTFRVDISGFLDGEVTSLRGVLPSEFDECGNATNLGDPTLAGFFPNGDALEYFRMNDSEFLQPRCEGGF